MKTRNLKIEFGNKLLTPGGRTICALMVLVGKGYKLRSSYYTTVYDLLMAGF